LLFNFDIDSTALKPEHVAFLEQNVLSAAQVNPSGLRVVIGGSADRLGDAAYNVALSNRRIEAVATFLRQRMPSYPWDLQGFGQGVGEDTAARAGDPDNTEDERFRSVIIEVLKPGQPIPPRPNIPKVFPKKPNEFPRPTPRPVGSCVPDAECPLSQDFTIQLLFGATVGDIAEGTFFSFLIRDVTNRLQVVYSLTGAGVATPGLPVTPAVAGERVAFRTSKPVKVTCFGPVGAITSLTIPNPVLPFIKPLPVFAALTFSFHDSGSLLPSGSVVIPKFDTGPISIPGAGIHAGHFESHGVCHGGPGAERSAASIFGEALAHEEEGDTNQDEIASEAELGIGAMPFRTFSAGALAESMPSDLRSYCARLGSEWSRQRHGSPTSEAMTSWLLGDYEETLEAARVRWGRRFGTSPFSIEAIGRAWMLGREANMKFQGGFPGVRSLGKFEPLVDPATLVSSSLIQDSQVAPVAPLLVNFVEELRGRFRDFVRASNYRGHGGGAFHNRGHSLDLFLEGIDDRGFYPKERAVSLLHAVHDSAAHVNAQWRAIYNDFDVADVVNRALTTRHVVFVGETRKQAGAVTGLNWHGPAPLILHLHLDLAPLAGAASSTWNLASGSAPVRSTASHASAGMSVSKDVVRFAQRVLNVSVGEHLSVDGDFGSRTRAALERFRQRHGVGVGVGLDASLQLALAQHALEQLAQQSLFARLGAPDPATNQAIARFKLKHALGSGSNLDAKTLAALAQALEARAAASVGVIRN
jgi:peptidoglycan hydrolase-like protein with peptidoglycan-binding domain